MTAGSNMIPDTVKEKPQAGKVIAVGKGKLKEDGSLVLLTLKVGDRIIFGQVAGTEIKIDHEDVVMMKKVDVMSTRE